MRPSWLRPGPCARRCTRSSRSLAGLVAPRHYGWPMSPRLLLALAAFVVALVGCGGDSNDTPPAAEATSTTAALDSPDGTTGEGATPNPDGSAGGAGLGVPLESAEGRFRIELPTEATLDEQTVDAGGQSLDLSLYTAQVDAGLVYNVGFVDYPEEILDVDPQLVLDGVVQGAAGNVSGTVASQSSVEMFGFPGTDYVIEVAGGTVQSRALLVDRRLYLLQRAGGEPSADEFSRLVGSFELL